MYGHPQAFGAELYGQSQPAVAPSAMATADMTSAINMAAAHRKAEAAMRGGSCGLCTMVKRNWPTLLLLTIAVGVWRIK